MLTFHDTADDTIAVVVGDKLTGADLDTLMDRLEGMLARHGTVHVFVEVRSLDGLEIGGLASHVGRAMPMFGRLGQFGRVAVVADQAWLRGLTRVESALLPFVSYRVFEPEGSAEALAWVTGG